MLCHHQIAVLCFMPRGVIYFRFLFCAILSSLSIAEASVAIPRDVMKAAIPPPEPPASGESPALPAEEVGCFLSLLHRCSAPTVRSVCYAESRPARVVLVNICRLFCSSCSICLLFVLFWWRVVLAYKAAFLTYVLFLMVFCFWRYILSKLVSMACVAFKLPFYSVCCSQTRFHGGYYPSFKFHSVLLLSCFHRVRCSQVAFLACTIFKLVFLACVAFRLFSLIFGPSS